MHDRLTIEPATHARLSELVPLFERQMNEHDIPCDAASLARSLEYLFESPASGTILVASLDGRAVGVAYVAFIWSIEHAGRAAWLEELNVDPAYRGKGIGESLLAAAIVHVRERGCRALDLEVEAGHERVERLYARAGFRRRSRTRFVLFL